MASGKEELLGYIIAVTRHVDVLLYVLLRPHLSVVPVTAVLPPQHGQKGQAAWPRRALAAPPALDAGSKPRERVLSEVYPLVGPGAEGRGGEGGR